MLAYIKYSLYLCSVQLKKVRHTVKTVEDMKRIEALLKSGVINTELAHTSQSESSSVFSFIYHGEDEQGKYILFGYVQKTNTAHNAVINGENIHAFHVELTDDDYNKLEYLW